MKSYKNLSLALAGASCALMGASVQAATSGEADVGDWDLSSAVLFYSEPDRVSAIEPILKGVKRFDTDETLTLKLTLDSLTGASANGALPSDRAQTFTRPSGNGSFVTDAGETPLDDTFIDTRVAFNASWEKPLSRMTRMNLSGNLSTEYDYTSLSVSSSFSTDFNQRNTTLSYGLSLAADTINPEGEIPIAFAAMENAGEDPNRRTDSDDKTTVDALVGLTQVIDRNSLFVVNYGLSQSDGYMTDPFKVVSLVDANGRPTVADAQTGLAAVVYENRPDSRTKHTLYAQYKRAFDANSLDLSYRFMTDDWGIDSHTLDMRYRFNLSPQSYWEPHVRLYQQGEADFYRAFYRDGDQPSPGEETQFASADYRLADMTAYTLGLEYGRSETHPWALAVEYYTQSPDAPGDAFGVMEQQELLPSVDAVMLRFKYDF